MKVRVKKFNRRDQLKAHPEPGEGVAVVWQG